MEKQIQALKTKIARHGIRLIIFIVIGICASLITKELGGKIDTQIMIGSAFVATLAGGYVFKYY
ncbi:MAG TPA: hypothetical protein VFN17_06220 [Nitrosarchaeum sp.]|nr:hypothetical protein [Nitrosarchaeum sp.]